MPDRAAVEATAWRHDDDDCAEISDDVARHFDGCTVAECLGTRTISGARPAPSSSTIADAYIYLLGRMLVIRQEHMDRSAPGFAYNTIKYNPIGSADSVNPNLDTAYLEAWFAVDDDTPVIFEVPEIKGRYYTAQILDEWGEVIANINERIFPSKPFGKFALVDPNSSARIPGGRRANRTAFEQGQAARPRRDQGRQGRGPEAAAGVQGERARHAEDQGAARYPDVRQQGSDGRRDFRRGR